MGKLRPPGKKILQESGSHNGLFPRIHPVEKPETFYLMAAAPQDGSSTAMKNLSMEDIPVYDNKMGL